MNKRIFYFALISISLQILRLFLVYKRISALWMTEIIAAFLIIVVPVVIFKAFRDRNNGKRKNIINVLGIIMTLPTILILMKVYSIYFYNNSETEIDCNSVKIYDKNNRKIPLDSLVKKVIQGGDTINSIKFEDK